MKSKHLLFLLLALLGSTTLRAYDACIDGIYYNFSGNEATVTYLYYGTHDNSAAYSGDIVIPESVTYNGKPYGVTSIGESAFKGCSGLTSITIPDGVTSIGESAFLGCSRLTSITIPNSVTYFDFGAFMSCYSLTSISIGSSVTSIGGAAFSGCTDLADVTFEDGSQLESIGEDAFSLCASLTTMTIPNGVTDIGRCAFIECHDLNSISLPNSVTCIGDHAFAGTGLTSITIPNSVTNIESSTFYGCTSLTSITIPDGVTSIGESALLGCSSLTSITIPNSVKNIGREAFKNSGLNTIILGKGNSDLNINGLAFSGCDNLTSIIVEDGNATFDSRNNCNAIIETATNTLLLGCKNTIIPESVTSIGDFSFYYCFGLTSITFPNGVTDIGQTAFYGCTNLTSITIPSSVTSIGESAFGECNNLNSITIPNSVTSIGDYAFGSCTSLSTISIPNSVTSIGDYTFYGCSSLTSITIPNSVTSIGNYAFSGCSSLTDVYCYAEQVPQTKRSAFGEVEVFDATLYVPAASVDSYRTTAPWNSFINIVGINKYVLSYIVDGNDYKSEVIWERQAIVPEEEPSKEGYTFSGWSEIPDTMPNHDVVVTGSFTINTHSLTYLLDGEVYKTDSISYGTTLTPEEELTKDGFTFSGWSEIPEIMPDHDVIVTGTFTINPCTIVFDTNGGSTIQSLSGEAGSTITPPEDPTREGYTFLGWEPAIPETIPQEGLVVKAIWQINSYALVYIIDGEEYNRSEIEYGAGITPLEEPAKDGYTFSGWSEIPGTMPAEDVTVTGSFTINQYQLTYILDGEEYKSYEIDYNTVLTPEVVPVKKGMTFSGWGDVPETMPAHDVTLTGAYSWSKETFDGIVYEVADTLSNYVAIVGYEGTDGEAEILSEMEFGGDVYEVHSIANNALPKTLTIHISVGRLLLWLWNNDYTDIKEIETGRDLSAPEVTLAAKSASSLTLSFANDYPEFSEMVEVSGTPIEKGENGYSMKLTGLDPDYEYEGLASVTLTFEDASYTKTCSFRTEPLNLNTLLPKVISEGNVIVAAESNLDDDEANVGFKWRRTAWEDDEEIFPSRSGVAYLYEGMMEGIIRNLSSYPWKVRPFYTSNAGNTYYGAWRGIDPSDYSYFEPTVHTYAALAVTDSTAEVKGYAMQGTDNVESQGIMYWENTPSSSSRRKANGIPDDAKIVEVFSPVMKVTLRGLDYDTEYNFVAFVKTANGETFYGEQQSFRTTFDPDGIKDIEGEQQSIDNGQQIYDLSGRMIGKPQKGINIIRYSDGSTRKVVLK